MRTERARIRVGVVGCGEVTQIIHLPTLSQLADRYEVTALCDISHTVLHGVADLWGIARRCTDLRELVAAPDVDVVLVANPDAYHADAALTAIAAARTCSSRSRCASVRASATRSSPPPRPPGSDRAGRLHAPLRAGVDRGQERLAELGEIRYARVHDLIGQNRLIIDRRRV